MKKTPYNFNTFFLNSLENSVLLTRNMHTLLISSSNDDKTDLQTAMMVALEKAYDLAIFILDKDRSNKHLIDTYQGDYFAIEEGVPTGINPFQFKDSPKLRDFLNDLVVSCGSDKDTSCSSEEQNQIKNAIDTVMNLPIEYRRFSSLLHSIPDRGGNSLYQRLLKWCSTEENQGRFAWCLDNPVNKFDAETFKIVGFEVGAILQEDYQPTEPLLSCLLYMKEEMVKNYELILSVIEECWLPLSYSTPQKMILDALRKGRKTGELLLLTTHSPNKLIKSPFLPTLLREIQNRIFSRFPDAEYKNNDGYDYSCIGLTQKEFLTLKWSEDSRTFLIKQSDFSLTNSKSYLLEDVSSEGKSNFYIRKVVL